MLLLESTSPFTSILYYLQPFPNGCGGHSFYWLNQAIGLNQGRRAGGRCIFLPPKPRREGRMRCEVGLLRFGPFNKIISNDKAISKTEKVEREIAGDSDCGRYHLLDMFQAIGYASSYRLLQTDVG